LFATLARIAAGKLPSESEQIPDVGFLQAFVSGSLIQLTIFVPFLLIMVLAVWRSGVWERRVIREELANEVGHLVTPEEYQAIVSDRMLRTRRVDRSPTSAALVNAQNELAFRKRRVRNEGGDPERDGLVAGWRPACAQTPALIQRERLRERRVDRSLPNGSTSRSRSRRSANANRPAYERARTASSPFHSHSSSRRRTVCRQRTCGLASSASVVSVRYRGRWSWNIVRPVHPISCLRHRAT